MEQVQVEVTPSVNGVYTVIIGDKSIEMNESEHPREEVVLLLQGLNINNAKQ